MRRRDKVAIELASVQTLAVDVDEIGRNRWLVDIDEPADTGFYNIFIEGDDASNQNNTGDEGVTFGDFFDGDDIDDDAIFFEGDILLPNPLVLIGGVNAEVEGRECSKSSRCT